MFQGNQKGLLKICKASSLGPAKTTKLEGSKTEWTYDTSLKITNHMEWGNTARCLLCHKRSSIYPKKLYGDTFRANKQTKVVCNST